MQENFYELLGIQRDYPQQKIAHAFRIKIKQVHPDKINIVDEVNNGKEATIKLYEAYKVLNDPVLRKQYDEKLTVKDKNQNLSSNRYFEQTNLLFDSGKWCVECEQCMGKTQIQHIDLEKIRKGDKNFFVKCWHCNLPLSIFIEQ